MAGARDNLTFAHTLYRMWSRYRMSTPHVISLEAGFISSPIPNRVYNGFDRSERHERGALAGPCGAFAAWA